METITGKTSQAIQDETLLIRRILDGHTELFRQLAGRYARQVLRMVASLIPSQEEAEEVTQDALLEAFQSLARGSRWDRHLGMGASSPKMRIEKRKSAAASVSLCMVLK